LPPEPGHGPLRSLDEASPRFHRRDHPPGGPVHRQQPPGGGRAGRGVDAGLALCHRADIRGQGPAGGEPGPGRRGHRGLNPVRMNLLAFGIGVGLAGAAGALIGPVFLISPVMGILPGVKSFVIIVLGGMGSIRGAIIASILLGLVESLGSVFFLDPTRGLAYKNAFGVLLLALVLLFRPTGLFGEKFVRLE
ncbi:TPA: hypothetical protein EYP13_03950, partial [Candidatus Micrarchaeota archaeon]|nr:hypothetical protein [Candidatus Micrarchaeota archaeon]